MILGSIQYMSEKEVCVHVPVIAAMLKTRNQLLETRL